MQFTDSRQSYSASELKIALRNSYLTLRVFTYFTHTHLGLIEKEDDEVLFAIAEELGKVW